MRGQIVLLKVVDLVNALGWGIRRTFARLSRRLGPIASVFSAFHIQ
jgi:hypothetical protein